MKKFFLYLLRWQLSSPILAICMVWLGGWNVVAATIAANLIGGCIFFWVDRWIFGDKKTKNVEDEVIILPSESTANATIEQ